MRHLPLILFLASLAITGAGFFIDRADRNPFVDPAHAAIMDGLAILDDKGTFGPADRGFGELAGLIKAEVIARQMQGVPLGQREKIRREMQARQIVRLGKGETFLAMGTELNKSTALIQIELDDSTRGTWSRDEILALANAAHQARLRFLSVVLYVTGSVLGLVAVLWEKFRRRPAAR